MSEERPWLKNYPKGIPANIDETIYPTLTALLDDTFKKFGRKEAFSCMGKELTFAQVDKQSGNFAAYLHSRGLEPGDKIALMMPNLLQYPIALFGCLRAGVVIVNTNPLYTPREMRHQFTDARVKAIVICENFAHHLQQVLPDTGIKTIIVTSIGELLGFPKGWITNFIVRYIKRMVPRYNLPNVVSFKEALRQGRKFSIKAFQASPEDVACLQYTGGTTGVAKGAMLTNRNLVANMMQIRAWGTVALCQGEEVALSPLPLYHIFAFTVNCLALFSLGALNVLVVNARDLPSVMKEFKKYNITCMTGVNTLFNALLHRERFAGLNFGSFKFALGGGMAVQKSVAEQWHKVTGHPLVEGYGMTESSPVASVNPLDGFGKLGSIGLPLPSTDMRIVADSGQALPAGEVGEIQIKGPQVMKGYYNRPEATAETIKDGWLSTGDIGMMHSDGYFQIVDRKKDMILVSGFNVFPNEIEGVVAAHPKVLECAAVGQPDEKSGEVVKIFIVKKDKSLTEKEIIAYCRENLTGYKVPKIVEFRKDLPKSNVGKILRRELRDDVAG
ncbi:MAG: long-chain-fatty-acid--CoA ligase [Saprospiraceae bacterium]|nr:MAG: long-chain-fatty-acid--CoA ligase [Saprospiraceae bacterium]